MKKSRDGKIIAWPAAARFMRIDDDNVIECFGVVYPVGVAGRPFAGRSGACYVAETAVLHPLHESSRGDSLAGSNFGRYHDFMAWCSMW